MTGPGGGGAPPGPQTPPPPSQGEDNDEGLGGSSSEEEPYTQDVPGSGPRSACAVGRKSEKIRPGDVILYYSHLYPAGDKRGRTHATVTSVDPKSSPHLRLSNGECLQDDHSVCRVSIVYRGKLIPHQGVFRPVKDFKLSKQSLSPEQMEGIQTEGKRAAAVLKRNVEELEERVGGSMDGMLNAFKFRDGGAERKKTKGAGDGKRPGRAPWPSGAGAGSAESDESDDSDFEKRVKRPRGGSAAPGGRRARDPKRKTNKRDKDKQPKRGLALVKASGR
mmetsp:Transcript_24891/g.49543  ORF Transcript_24891/g.49543 Transcript_24891/m.49543 type:complete len:277 (-) Transcript_24891:297-1127(-)